MLETLKGHIACTSEVIVYRTDAKKLCPLRQIDRPCSIVYDKDSANSNFVSGGRVPRLPTTLYVFFKYMESIENTLATPNLLHTGNTSEALHASKITGPSTHPLFSFVFCAHEGPLHRKRGTRLHHTGDAGDPILPSKRDRPPRSQARKPLVQRL